MSLSPCLESLAATKSPLCGVPVLFADPCMPPSLMDTQSSPTFAPGPMGDPQ